MQNKVNRKKRMENYNIYMNPQGDYKAVKSGWSWTAFLFTGIWALSNKPGLCNRD